MLLTRLSLRNYRVYEEPLDLELPPGLIGIYGPNGSGKSTLLEAILFALWGRARTAKEDVRTAGVGGDCMAEVTFEHEGHLYVVRRSLSGINLTARAEVQCDGLAMAEGVRDTSRYLHQVLGMDDAAFRASVFAEQKQLAAFSERTPSQRRELVLQLLGITPLDTARDAARKDAREVRQSHDRLRAMLPDLDQLRVQVADAAAGADAAVVIAETEEAAALSARGRAAAAEEAFGRLDRLRQEFDALVIEGRAARSQLDEATGAVGVLEAERAALVTAEAELESLLPRSAGWAEAETRLQLVSAVVSAEQTWAAVVVPPEPPVGDGGAVDEAERILDSARAAAAAVAGQIDAVTAELARARAQAARSADLSGAADCPLCGQALGDAFEQVQAHRAAEVEEAEARLSALTASRVVVDAAAAAARAEFTTRRDADTRRVKARQAWEQAQARQAGAEEAVAAARTALGDLAGAGWLAELIASVASPGAGSAAGSAVDPIDDAHNRASRDHEAWLAPLTASYRGGGEDSPDARGRQLRVSLAPLQAALQVDVEGRRAAAAAVQRLQGRLERRGVVASQLEQARERAAESQHRVMVLRDKVRSLGFDKEALEAAEAARSEAQAADVRAARLATEARLEAARAIANAEGEARRLADGVAQHAKLVTLSDDSRHLGRMAELLSAFRNTIVATVGPRLAVQAAELFGELTDQEYDRLEVDPETYELQICDGGRVFGLDRFSGSEVDLANLALRVAISEHVRFQSGGTVGLLVLDEVFGPLDEHRKARMLQALERLRGRFRQILVVTHDADIKEQLPHAIEVQKRPGRRATARLLDS
ncbi:MAG: SMC family ATPase [Actinomycetota bacterium]|nr:SMC family ATPase [Actinomycetota bacterium]